MKIGRKIGAVVRGACRAIVAKWAKVSAPTIRVEFVKDRPQQPHKNRLYVTQQAGHPAFGAMACPCGCGETLNLRFFGERRPRWSVRWDRRRRPTVRPSVWRQSGCRSHFHLTAGRVDWCE
jgi:hypothetical protein